MAQGTTENQTLIDFWDKAFSMSVQGQKDLEENSWKEMAPSEKLYLAACSLGQKKKVLDYGCGTGWAGIIAAKNGCPDVTAADVAEGAVNAAEHFASFFQVKEQVHTKNIGLDWLKSVPEKTYDGFICSNVLDVVPPETAEEIIRESARIVTADASVIIGMNYYLSPERAKEKGIELKDGMKVYMNGVLRLVSRTDEEWSDLFSPYYFVEKLEHFAWPGEAKETRRLFYLKRKG